MTRKLSIIIPIYNQEELLKRAILSCPVRKDIEIIVVDDGSTDGSWKAINDTLDMLGAQDVSVKGIHYDLNQGVAHALNRGLEEASGEYYIALGSDDYFLTDNLNELIDNHLDGTDMVYFNLEINDGSLIEPKPETVNVWVGSTKAYRRDFIGDIQYPETRKAHEDLKFDADIRSQKPTMTFTGITVKHYNFPREGSLTWKVESGELTEKDITGKN